MTFRPFNFSTFQPAQARLLHSIPRFARLGTANDKGRIMIEKAATDLYTFESLRKEHFTEAITHDCGFVNRTHLKKLFLRTFGCSMREWRNRSARG